MCAAAGFLVRTIQASTPSGSRPDLQAPEAIALLGGTFLGLVAAAVTTWNLLRPTRNPWRQGMLGMVAAFATLVVSLVTIPVDMTLGRTGLAGLVAAAAVGCVLIGRRLGRSGGMVR